MLNGLKDWSSHRPNFSKNLFPCDKNYHLVHVGKERIKLTDKEYAKKLMDPN